MLARPAVEDGSFFRLEDIAAARSGRLELVETILGDISCDDDRERALGGVVEAAPAAGDPARVEALARSLDMGRARITALGRVAEALADAGDLPGPRRWCSRSKRRPGPSAMAVTVTRL